MYIFYKLSYNHFFIIIFFQIINNPAILTKFLQIICIKNNIESTNNASFIILSNPEQKKVTEKYPKEYGRRQLL